MATAFTSTVKEHWHPRSSAEIRADLARLHLELAQLPEDERTIMPAYSLFLASTLSQTAPSLPSRPAPAEVEPPSRTSSRPRESARRLPSPPEEAASLYPTPEDYFTSTRTIATPALTLGALCTPPFILPQAIPEKGITMEDWVTLWHECKSAYSRAEGQGEEQQTRAVAAIVERSNEAWFNRVDVDVYLELGDERITAPSPRPFRLTHNGTHSSTSSSNSEAPLLSRPPIRHDLSHQGSIVSFNAFLDSTSAPNVSNPTSKEGKRLLKEQEKADKVFKKAAEKAEKLRLKEEKGSEASEEAEEKRRRRELRLARIVVVVWERNA